LKVLTFFEKISMSNFSFNVVLFVLKFLPLSLFFVLIFLTSFLRFFFVLNFFVSSSILFYLKNLLFLLLRFLFFVFFFVASLLNLSSKNLSFLFSLSLDSCLKTRFSKKIVNFLDFFTMISFLFLTKILCLALTRLTLSIS